MESRGRHKKKHFRPRFLLTFLNFWEAGFNFLFKILNNHHIILLCTFCYVCPNKKDKVLGVCIPWPHENRTTDGAAFCLFPDKLCNPWLRWLSISDGSWRDQALKSCSSLSKKSAEWPKFTNTWPYHRFCSTAIFNSSVISPTIWIYFNCFKLSVIYSVGSFTSFIGMIH